MATHLCHKSHFLKKKQTNTQTKQQKPNETQQQTSTKACNICPVLLFEIKILK